MAFFEKLRGAGKSPPRVGALEIGLSCVGAFLGMVVIGLLQEHVADPADALLLIGSMAASAVLLFGTPKSPLAQPRNVLGGHMLSACVGVSAHLLFPTTLWLAGAVAVAGAISLMHATKTLHPPGGATALIAITGGPKILALGYGYVLLPAGAGALVLLAVALVVNNLLPGRKYPEFWW
jgi:CBS-domain-containing membrane protein